MCLGKSSAALKFIYVYISSLFSVRCLKRICYTLNHLLAVYSIFKLKPLCCSRRLELLYTVKAYKPFDTGI